MDKRAVHTSSEIVTIFVHNFFHTAVSTNKMINETGSAYISANQVCVMVGIIMLIVAKLSIAINQTRPAQHKHIVARFLLILFLFFVVLLLFGSEIKESMVTP